MTIYEEMTKKTKEKIELTYLKLLQQKPFTKISIRDLTEEASISRWTFYLHYKDKSKTITKT